MIREICLAFLVVVVTVHMAEGSFFNGQVATGGDHTSYNGQVATGGDHTSYNGQVATGGDHTSYNGQVATGGDYTSYNGQVATGGDHTSYNGQVATGGDYTSYNDGYSSDYGGNNNYGDYNGNYNGYGVNNGYGSYNGYDDDYNYNNYGYNSDGYAGYINDKNEYFAKYHGIKIVGNRFNYGGKDYRLSCGLNRFYGYWNRCYGQLHSTRGCVGQLLKEHRFDIYGDDYDYNNYGYNSDGYAGYNNDENEYYAKYHGIKIVGNRFIYGGKDYRLSCGLNRFYGYWNKCYGTLHSTIGCVAQLLKEHRFDIYRAQNYLYKKLKIHKKIVNNHVKKINYIAKAHIATINNVAKGHTNAIKYTAKKHVGIIAAVANKHINKIKAIVQTHLYKLHKQTKNHLYAVEVQHKKHMTDRSYQNKALLAIKESLHQKHKAYINRKLSKYNNDADY